MNKFNFTRLLTEYYCTAVASVALLPCALFDSLAPPSKSMPTLPTPRITALHCLVIGLGGGVIAGALRHNLEATFPSVVVNSVEIDEEVARLACEHFGCAEQLSPAANQSNEDGNDSAGRPTGRCLLGDGLLCVKGFAEDSQHLVIVDANGSDPEGSIICPAEPFLATPFLNDVHRTLHPLGGALVFNLVSRSKEATDKVLSRLTAKFSQCLVFQSAEDVNKVVVCFKSAAEDSASVMNRFERNLLRLISATGDGVFLGHTAADWRSQLSVL